MKFAALSILSVLSNLLDKQVNGQGISQTVTPLLSLCDDGMVDTAVRTIDGKVYIFKGDHYFDLDINNIIPNPEARPLSDWAKLPNNTHASFTITDRKNILYGKTFFFKQTKWWQFENKQFERSNETSWWVVDPINARYVLPMHNESIFGFFSLSAPRVVIGNKAIFEWYNFHDPRNPDLIPLAYVIDSHFSFDLYTVRAIVDFPDGKWLLFGDDGYDGYYCLLNHPGDYCNEKYIWMQGICPDLMSNFVEDSVFLKALDKVPFSVDKMFSVIFGILMAGAIIQTVVIIGLTAIIEDFMRIKNRENIFRLLLERQKTPYLPYISFGKHLLQTTETSLRHFQFNHN